MLSAAMSFGANITKLRDRAGLSKTELAEAMNITPQRVWDWENNRKKSLDARTLVRLAMALNCSTDEILEGIEGYELRAQQLTSKGGSDVPASSLTSGRLEQEVSDFATAARKITNQLIDLIGEHEVRIKHGAAAPTQTGVRRRDRKAG